MDEVRAKGAQAVILLSHNGADVDLKLASRVTGIDVVLGGHMHDAIPAPIIVNNKSGKTLVTNAGSNGKFLAVLDRQSYQQDGVTWQAAGGRETVQTCEWRRWGKALRGSQSGWFWLTSFAIRSCYAHGKPTDLEF